MPRHWYEIQSTEYELYSDVHVVQQYEGLRQEYRKNNLCHHLIY